jgi:hypothetical protein
MKLTPLTALILLGCGNAASTGPTQDPAQLGTAAAAIRALGQHDADVVKSCDDLAKRCNEFVADSGAGAVCEKIVDHCNELAAQLSEARSDFQACLEQVASCEESAADPADCATQRAACNPAGKDFEARRGATLECAARTQSCLPRGSGFAGGRQDADDDRAGDAGAAACDDGAMDFVGCCHGRGGAGFGGAGFGGPGARADGGVPGFGDRDDHRGPSSATGSGGPGRADDADDDHEGPGHGGQAVDAGGAERPDFGGGPGRR